MTIKVGDYVESLHGMVGVVKTVTIIRIGYNKPGLGVWYIVREHVGTAEQTLLVCEDEDADPYSDVFCINAEIKRHEVLGGNFGEVNITEQ